MKIVIDVPEDVYTRLFDNDIQDNEIAVDDVCEMARALRLGTPLPKGYGDLKDINTIKQKLMIWDYKVNAIPNYAWKCIEDAPIIIGADKEG